MKPTFLYIKQHTITGKCYFGKTTRKDPIKYSGSGKHWQSHLKVHGCDHVDTIWYCLFTEKDELNKCALLCSQIWNIVKSNDWANEKAENGLDGGIDFHSESTRNKLAIAGKNRVVSKETRSKLSLLAKGRPCSDQRRKALSDRRISKETRSKLSASSKGRVWSLDRKNQFSSREISIETRKKISDNAKIELECPYCFKRGSALALRRWHFNNCKLCNAIGE
jgi:aspartate carbamoyltransferase regulatory subunit